MEEQKTKEVKMSTENKEPQKLSYEDLHKACVQLSQENQYLKNQLQQAERYIQTFNRLDYLFKVVGISMKESKWHFSEDFVTNCLKEIEEILTIPEEEESDKTN